VHACRLIDRWRWGVVLIRSDRAATLPSSALSRWVANLSRVFARRDALESAVISAGGVPGSPDPGATRAGRSGS
jgi:hypothetical protein